MHAFWGMVILKMEPRLGSSLGNIRGSGLSWLWAIKEQGARSAGLGLWRWYWWQLCSEAVAAANWFVKHREAQENKFVARSEWWYPCFPDHDMNARRSLIEYKEKLSVVPNVAGLLQKQQPSYKKPQQQKPVTFAFIPSSSASSH